MTIIIRPGTEEDTQQVYRFMNDQKEVLPYLGGFSSYDDYLKHFTKGNSQGDYNLVAVDGDEIVGCSLSKGKKHYLEQDFNAVIPGRRREGIGSHLYMSHRRKAMLEGRLFVLDQIIDFNPHMPYFLGFLNFERIAHLRQRIRNFSGLYHYRYDLSRGDLAKNKFNFDKFEIQMDDRDEYKESFDTNVKLLKDAGQEDRVELLHQNRELALSGEWAD